MYQLKDMNDVLTVEETAKVLRLSVKGVYKMLHYGTLNHRRQGRKYLIPKLCVLDYLNAARYTDM